MRNINTWLVLIFLTVANIAFAGIPAKYYISIDGDSYIDLKNDLSQIISNHKILGYSSLWNYYPSTYYHPDNKSQVLDMYSDIVRYYNGSTAVAGMNKEHTVPKSWWGGSTAAAPGNDLFNVIPSDEKANSSKSNYSLGIVKTETFSNGVTTVGKGTVNGHSATFFEPKDDYKGDFARIYLYMATCYPDLAWDSNNADAMTSSNKLTLQAWIIPMLLEWHQNDPVDAAEIQRNEDIYQIQGNRNPFIDYPVLAEYIWGSKSQEIFYLNEHKPNEGTQTTLQASTPKFSLVGGTETEPLEIAAGTSITITASATTAILYTRVNGGEWTKTNPTTGWNPTTGTEYHTAGSITYEINANSRIDAYCTQEGRENSDVVTFYYNAVDFSSDYLLYEPFDEVTAGNNTSTSGSSTAWSGNKNFPTNNDKVYQAGNAIKLGSSSASGKITSRQLVFNGGNAMVSVDVKGWSIIEGKLNVTLGDETQAVEYTSKMSDNFETHVLMFNNVKANPTLIIETTSKRAFVDNIKVSASGSDGIEHITNLHNQENDVIFDLQGVRYSAMPVSKGIYIINGKKVFVR